MTRSPVSSGTVVWLIGTVVALLGLIAVALAPDPQEVVLVQSIPVEPVVIWTIRQVVGGAVVIVGVLVAAVGLGRVAARRRDLPSDQVLAWWLLGTAVVTPVCFWARLLGSGTQVPTYGPPNWDTAITAWGPVSGAATLVLVASWVVMAAVSTVMIVRTRTSH